jgi:hypothetical protein
VSFIFSCKEIIFNGSAPLFHLSFDLVSFLSIIRARASHFLVLFFSLPVSVHPAKNKLTNLNIFLRFENYSVDWSLVLCKVSRFCIFCLSYLPTQYLFLFISVVFFSFVPFP